VSGRIVVTTCALSVIAPAVFLPSPQSPSEILNSRQAVDAFRFAFRVLPDERTDPPCLGSGEELTDDTAGGQIDRVLGVGIITGGRYSATLNRARPSGK
jgi:hypothetical protein